VTGAYFDSSALVKLYANEQHHVAVRALKGVIVTSSLALVEVTAAFFGKVRSGEISIETAQVLADTFHADWADGHFLRVAVDEHIEQDAAQLVSRYALRGFDAVHLSTANAARRALPEYSTFVCFDKKLSEAAAGEQFGLFHTQ
jgi:uncharacterized protein